MNAQHHAVVQRRQQDRSNENTTAITLVSRQHHGQRQQQRTLSQPDDTISGGVNSATSAVAPTPDGAAVNRLLMLRAKTWRRLAPRHAGCRCAPDGVPTPAETHGDQ
jgi:hypothetical protein